MASGGFWSKLAGIGLGAAGIATGQPELVGAGVGLLGAGISADASQKAADQQTQASNNALGVQQQIYQQTRKDLMPYASTGVAAEGNLRTLLGLPTLPVVTGTDGSAQLMPTYNPYPNGGNGQPNGPGSGYQPPQPGQFVPATQGITYGTPAVPAGQSRVGTLGAMSAATGLPLTSQAGGGLVTVRAPTGETMQLPADQAMRAMQLGATRVQ